MELNEVNQPPKATVRAAATVVLMRDTRNGPEVLLTVRPKSMRFMGGASVFPGGAVAPADLDPRWEQASQLTMEQAGAALASENASAALGRYVCALREAFEEVGYPPCADPSPDLRADAERADEFLESCLAEGVKLDTDRLVPGGRWVTPEGSPIRFDTSFFLTRVPDGWEPIPDPDEVDRAEWVTPQVALDEMGSGDRAMAPPTVEMLQRLAELSSVDEALSGFGDGGLTGPGNVLSLRVSPLVLVILAPNAGMMTGPGTNTYIVGSGPYLVIDPAVDDDEYLDAIVEATNGDIAAIVITHRHSDHTGGALGLSQRTGAPVRAFGHDDAGGVTPQPLADGDELTVPGVTLRALHTPGHASDHLCLYMVGAASLFAGDNVLGEGTAVIAPPDGDMGAYLESLERMRELHIDRIYPGHWKPLDGGRAVIDGYLAHRRERERKIVGALRPEPSTLEEIVARAYDDTPEHLHPVAAFSARAHLDMLEGEGRAIRSEDRWREVPQD